MYEGVVVYSGQCPRLESLARVGRGISPQHGLQGVGDRTLNTFICVYTVYRTSIGSVVSATIAFDCVVIACSLESIRPGLVQGCKVPYGVGWACLITSLELGHPTEQI